MAGERERERERERETERPRDRDGDRQRQRQTETDRQRIWSRKQEASGARYAWTLSFSPEVVLIRK